jgi:hypothetical protein
MSAIVEFPRIVDDEVKRFADLFANEPQRRHFGECLTGLIVAPGKTVTGVNAEFASTTDPSCLNRFLAAAERDVEALNARRLELLQETSATRGAASAISRSIASSKSAASRSAPMSTPLRSRVKTAKSCAAGTGASGTPPPSSICRR